MSPVAQIKFVQHNAGAAECVSLNHIATHRKETRVDVTNDVRTAQDQHFTAIFLAPIIIQRGIALVNVGAHGTVVNDDALVDGLEEIRHSV